MGEYNFWADLLFSYRASSDILKALWVLAPPCFVLGLVAILRLTRRGPRRDEGEAAYIMTREPDGVIRIRRDAAAEPRPIEYGAGRTADPSERSPFR